MKLLLDTCTFLWIALEPKEFSKTATTVYTDPANSCYLSTVSAWEIGVQYLLGRINLAQPPTIFVPAERANHRIAELALTEQSALRVFQLPSIHKDPFDRMLVCQAMVENMILLTPDPMIQQYPVSMLW
jgi:PIN domain nuclease of toxin-antitoxin system